VHGGSGPGDNYSTLGLVAFEPCHAVRGHDCLGHVAIYMFVPVVNCLLLADQ